MKKSLTEIQELFLSSIRGSESSLQDMIEPISNMTSIDCLKIYSNGYFARLSDALGETYEATWWALGDEDFFTLTKIYIDENPSYYFDLSDFGGGFSEFLKTQKQIKEIPFLVDLADFEWIFMEVFHKPDLPRNADLFQKDINENTKLIPSPSVRLFKSTHPIYQIWKLRTQPVEKIESIIKNMGDAILVYKMDSQVHIKTLDQFEWLLMHDLFNGVTIGEALEHLSKTFQDIEPETVQKTFSAVAQMGVFADKENRV